MLPGVGVLKVDVAAGGASRGPLWLVHGIAWPQAQLVPFIVEMILFNEIAATRAVGTRPANYYRSL